MTLTIAVDGVVLELRAAPDEVLDAYESAVLLTGAGLTDPGNARSAASELVAGSLTDEAWATLCFELHRRAADDGERSSLGWLDKVVAALLAANRPPMPEPDDLAPVSVSLGGVTLDCLPGLPDGFERVAAAFTEDPLDLDGLLGVLRALAGPASWAAFEMAFVDGSPTCSVVDLFGAVGWLLGVYADRELRAAARSKGGEA
jgi:hypothetical protein